VSTTIVAARQLIESRLAELHAEARDLERALASLGARPAPRRRRGRPKKAAPAPAKAKPRAARKRKSKRAPRGARREQLLAAIKANPGARPAELARSIGISSNQVHSLIAKARKDKLLVKKSKGYALKG
jgi:Winged helix-turn-helix DNA-binding